MTGSPTIVSSGAIRFSRPLVSSSAAIALIPAKRQEELVALIESGVLRWAFDIGRGKRREIRVLGHSINAYLSGGVVPDMDAEVEFSRVIATIFPQQDAPDIRAVDLAVALNTGTDHIFGLHTDGLLTLIQGCRWGRGASGSPRFQFSSVVNFLKKRRIL